MPRRQSRLPGAPRPAWIRALGWIAWTVLAGFCVADDLETARGHFLVGKYLPCLEVCAKQEPDAYPREEWNLLRARTQLAIGQYLQAELTVSNALVRSENSIRLRLLGIETANRSGATDLAKARLREINELGSSRMWAYREAPDLVALGRVALMMGADPKTVLERLFMPARKADPKLRDAWLASGDLALDKHDFALAAKTFQEALKTFPGDAEFLCGLARAYQPNARGPMLEQLKAALAKNENHVPSLVLLADHLVDAEEHAEADRILTRAIKVNPWHPEAWAYLAVLAHLRSDTKTEEEARRQALTFWKTNPEVDHTIGRKLSQNYRFAEGAACQRRALAFDPAYLPARMQLAQDLLRLGEEGEGWKLAEEVNKQDGYDVTAYNLVTLRSTMQEFQTLTNADFVLRMSASEATLYGDRALALLQRARARLAEKYGVTLASPTIIEIFPEQKDFGVRTFGMPGNPGFLGVCFGRVVTANSPASQGGHPANWEAVLWHEFCHVVTLQMTRNQMPRWLSEGISVYEELQADPAWGQSMNPRYREMILEGELKPVGELSAAFLSPKSDVHVQFAYFQSALVVQFLVERYGFDPLKLILRDLGDGVGINTAIPRHTAPMDEVEKGFAAFAKARAEALGPGLDWKKPDEGGRILDRIRAARTAESVTVTPPVVAPVEPSPAYPAASTDVPKPESGGGLNYWTLMEQATSRVAREQWREALEPIQTLLQHYPEATGAGGPYALLAVAHRGLQNAVQERVALEKWALLDGDALEAYLRLMELAGAAKDWPAVVRNGERVLAVNPLLPQPYRSLGRAREELGQIPEAIGAYRKLLLLDPPDPADVHFRLARLLQRQGDPAARRHALQALEEAPRFLEAHRLLLELAQAVSPTNAAPEVKP